MTRMVVMCHSVTYARQSYHVQKLHCSGMQRGENIKELFKMQADLTKSHAHIGIFIFRVFQ